MEEWRRALDKAFARAGEELQRPATQRSGSAPRPPIRPQLAPPAGSADFEGREAEPNRRNETTRGAAASDGDAATGPINTLAAGINSREALRRTFVLREILGPPVALRDGGQENR